MHAVFRASTEPIIFILAMFAIGRAAVLWMAPRPQVISVEGMEVFTVGGTNVVTILTKYAPLWLWITFFILLGICKIVSLADSRIRGRCALFSAMVWSFHTALVVMLERQLDAQRITTFAILTMLSLWVYWRERWIYRS